MIHAARGDDAAAGKAHGGHAADPGEAARSTWRNGADGPSWWRPIRPVHRPELRPPALALAEILADRAEKKPATEASNRWPTTLWEVQAKHLRARAASTRRWRRTRPGSGDRGVSPWQGRRADDGPVARRGLPGPALVFGDGGPLASARSCRRHDVPRRPDAWEVRACLRADRAGRAVRSASPTAARSLGLKADLKHLERSQIGRPDARRRHHSAHREGGRLVRAAAGRRTAAGMTVSINGRKVHEAPMRGGVRSLAGAPVPGHAGGSARKIAISGTPAGPRAARTSPSCPTSPAGAATSMPRPRAGDNADWEKRGEEVVGRLIEDIPGARQESVLRYHRPMLEDGRIAYEFYYDPGKAMVHPSLDRLAFLIEPEGVRRPPADRRRLRTLGTRARQHHGRAEGPTRARRRCRSSRRRGTACSVEIKGDKVTPRAQRPGDLRADPRADQPARVRALPLRRRHPGPRAQRDLSGRMAPGAAWRVASLKRQSDGSPTRRPRRSSSLRTNRSRKSPSPTILPPAVANGWYLRRKMPKNFLPWPPGLGARILGISEIGAFKILQTWTILLVGGEEGRCEF